jgi:hypothetical protein
MSPYHVPEAAGAPPVNVLPTERLLEIVETFEHLERSLTEIAAGFREPLPGEGSRAWCLWCDNSMYFGCDSWCPGLLARRALGVA